MTILSLLNVAREAADISDRNLLKEIAGYCGAASAHLDENGPTAEEVYLPIAADSPIRIVLRYEHGHPIHHELLEQAASCIALVFDRTAARKDQRQVRGILMSLSHQLRTPIVSAHRQLRRLLDGPGHATSPEFKTAIAHVARAEQVANSSRLFADLADDKPIRTAPCSLSSAELVSRIRDLAYDAQAIVGPSTAIHFTVSAPEDERYTVIIDLTLVEHAIVNLLDNAAKFSYPETQILVSIALDPSKEFALIRIRNRGILLTSSDADRCGERGFQTINALRVNATGSGIGLWLVREIARAHAGSFRMLATDQDGWTTAELRLRAAQNE